MGLGLTVKALLRSLVDDRTPAKQKLAAILAFIYTISPIDLISDTVLLFGVLDDGIVLTGLLVLLKYYVPEQVYTEHEEQYQENPGIGMGKIALGLLVLWLLTVAVLLWAIFS